MPVALTYPGVYIEEVSSGVRTIIGVATSITAFIGRTQRGPTDRPVRVQGFAEFERVYGGLWELSTLSYAVQHFFLNGGSEALIARVHNGAVPATLVLPTFSLEAANGGLWGQRLRVRVDHDTNPVNNTTFNLTVRNLAGGGTERFLNLSTASASPRFVERVLRQESNLVRVSGGVPAGALAPPAHAPVAVGGDPFDPNNAATSAPFAANGNDGVDIGQAQVSDPALEAGRQGLWMLDHVDLFNLLCIPPFTWTVDVPLNTWDEAARYCDRRRAFLIVDPPAGWNDPADAVAGLGAVITRTDTAAVYFPRIMAADPLRDFRQETFAPCGAVAGVIARTDAERGVWKAPAGLDALMFGVSALSMAGEPGILTDPQVGLLNPIGINCLRTIPNTGHVIWGSRTRDGADQFASEWKYIPVRRLAYNIEESLFRGTQWVVFEPNDEPLWAQIRLNVGTFMQRLFTLGAFKGASPREAYFVKCSKETTTQADIDAGIVNILVGFAPLKPAEFVVIRIQQIAQSQA